MADCERLSGVVSIPKDLFWEEEWLDEPFSRGMAWLDLWMLANDRQREVLIRGVYMTAKRGQLVRGLRGLSERWHWSRDKTTAFLEHLERKGRITVEESNVASVITVIDYTIYNPDTGPGGVEKCRCAATKSATEPTTNPTTDKATEPTTVLRSGLWPDLRPDLWPKNKNPATEPTTEPTKKLEEGSWKGEGATGPVVGSVVGSQGVNAGVEIPSDEEVADFCREWKGDLARGIPPAIPAGWWTGWLAVQIGRERFPRDWRRSLALAFVSDWVNRHPKALNLQKNAGGGEGGNGTGLGLHEEGELRQLKAIERQRGKEAATQ